jgi:DNA polymerase III alpha subunit (gram-positive type)
MKQFIVLDTETGGLGKETSLLSAFFRVVAEDMSTVLGELSLFLKPDDENYVVTAQGLAVNKIDLVKHNTTAITYREAGTLLYDFLKLHSDNGKNKLIPVGHNVVFDIGKICDNLMSKKSWEHMVSYRTLDTGTIAQFLLLTGHLGEEVSGSLGSLAKAFGVTEVAAHTAAGDVDVTAAVMKAMLKQIYYTTLS